ncbi:MAG TPA: VOC family protein [Planctomycetaceae bacterium]|nr:VOC family protein [Planctomycetaceae bacterium]
MTPLEGLVFHHVGIACERIENEIPHYELIGYRAEGQIFEDSRQVIRGLFMKAGAMQIELIEPLRPESPVCTFIARGVQMYHQAFLSHNLRAAVRTLVDRGAVIVSHPKPAVAFGGRQVCFLLLPNRMLIELIATI